MVLVHGGSVREDIYKGDFLCTEMKNGPVRFINVAGEDGALTLRGGARRGWRN